LLTGNGLWNLQKRTGLKAGHYKSNEEPTSWDTLGQASTTERNEERRRNKNREAAT